jgi:hypothetical protein
MFISALWQNYLLDDTMHLREPAAQDDGIREDRPIEPGCG